MDKKEDFYKIELNVLSEGMLADRTLFLYLKRNNRYVPIVKIFHLIDAAAFSKIQKSAEVYSDKKPVEEQFPELAGSVTEVLRILNDDSLAPFESSYQIRKRISWFAKQILEPEKFETLPADSLDVCVHFVQRLLDRPNKEMLKYLSERNVVVSVYSIKAAAVAVVMALWLGYISKALIESLYNIVLLQDIGVMDDAAAGTKLLEVLVSNPASLTANQIEFLKEKSKRSLDLIKKNKWDQYLVSSQPLQWYFAEMIAPAAASDLSVIGQHSRWMALRSEGFLAEQSFFGKVISKLQGIGRAA